MPRELPLDMQNDYMAEIVFRRKHMNLFKKLAQRTHFDVREVEALCLIHRKIVEVMGPLHRLNFRDVIHAGLDFTENMRHLLVDRIFSATDNQNVLQLQMDHWCEGLSVMLRGNLKEKMQFGYKVYDNLKTGKLKKEQIFPMMRGCLIKQQSDEDPDESVKDLIELMLKKLDVDRDGKVSENDYRTAVKDRNILFLECMGPLFPTREAQYTFLTTFTHPVNRF